MMQPWNSCVGVCYGIIILYIIIYFTYYIVHIILYICWISLLRHADKSVRSCHMYCTCSSITLHSKLCMSSLFIFIIVNVMFYLFYLQVEPVYLRVSNNCYPITSVSSISATVLQHFGAIHSLIWQEKYKCPSEQSHSH